MNKRHLLAVARGEQNADLVLRNAQLVNVFSGTIEATDIAIAAGKIAGIGQGYAGDAEIDLAGRFVAPGLIDAHVHIESSLCIPAQFARAVVPRGVTTVVTDPHEIANVAGIDGIRFIAENSADLPLSVVIMAPSCVPATAMETNGATLNADDLAGLLRENTVHGLAEVMNFPGVVYGDEDILAKVAAFHGRPIDGHAPALYDRMLNAYVAAGIGSEHECTTAAEAEQKLARGLYILIREATNAHNLHALLPMITEQNSRRICFCTDDRIPADLIDQGSVDYMVREAIRFGIAPVTALRMATLNAAEWFGLHDRGAVAPGRRADLIVFDDLEQLELALVFADGRLVAEAGAICEAAFGPIPPLPATVASLVNVRWEAVDLRVAAESEHIRVIGMIENQLVTEEHILPATMRDGLAVADPERDLLKMVVVDRHRGSGSQGIGFIQGIGLQRGALAGTVAHDHHNLVAIGADDDSMWAAARAVMEMGGGLAVANGSEILASLALPVAGLMSDCTISEVRAGYDAMIAAAGSLGSPLHDPLMAMSFMALEVIPKLKLTDQGLVDVEQFKVVPLFWR